MYIPIEIIKQIIVSGNYPSKYLVYFISVCKQLACLVSPMYNALLLQESVFAKPFFPNKLVSMTRKHENRLYNIGDSVKIFIGKTFIGEAIKTDCTSWDGHFVIPHDIGGAFGDHIRGKTIDNKYLELFDEVNKVVRIIFCIPGMFGWGYWDNNTNLCEVQCKIWELWAIIQHFKQIS